MTDATPTPSNPPAAPVAAGPKQTLSIVGFILGIGSVVFAWTFFVGIGAGIAAIIVSRKARKDEPGAPKWMPQVGIITGIVGIILGVLFGIIWLASFIIPLLILGSYGSVVSGY